MKLYENIKRRRQELGLTQEELAKRVGYKSISTIAKIESGINDIPQSKIVAFAEALNTTPGELMGEVESEEILTTQESQLLEMFHQLPPEMQEEVLDFIYFKLMRLQRKQKMVV